MYVMRVKYIYIYIMYVKYIYIYMFLSYLSCIKLSMLYKKFSFFILSREEKDKYIYVNMYLCLVYILCEVSIHVCMELCVCRVELSIYTYVSLSSSTCTQLCM